MNIGILQGRLSPPNGGFQEFPKDWKKEFVLAEELGLNHIDWLVTKNCSYHSNPIFNEDLSKLNINSICADNLISKRIISPDFLFNNLLQICVSAIKNNIYSITIPLLEESGISDVPFRKAFIDNMNNFAITYYPEITFSFEIESYEDAISDVLDSNPNFRLTYDTGNMTSLGISHEYYLDKFSDRIDNIHLKDRTYEGNTVWPGSGKTDFGKIFEIMSDKQDLKYTIQTDRGSNGEEYKTIEKHFNYFNKFWRKR
jgi:hypothetical protein